MSTDDRPEIDGIDRTIIRALVRNGRMSIRRLAEEVALSTSATSERVHRLEAAGAITGYRAEVSPDVLDRPVDAVVGVRGRPGADRTALEAWFVEQDSIVEAVHLTGPHDDVLRLRCRSTAELDDVLMAMKHDGVGSGHRDPHRVAFAADRSASDLRFVPPGGG